MCQSERLSEAMEDGGGGHFIGHFLTILRRGFVASLSGLLCAALSTVSRRILQLDKWAASNHIAELHQQKSERSRENQRPCLENSIGRSKTNAHWLSSMTRRLPC